VNLGLSFVVSLALLLPGIIFQFVLRQRILSGEFAVSPPPPSSIETLGVVTLVSLLTHFLIGSMSWLNYLYYSNGCSWGCLEAPFDPRLHNALAIVLFPSVGLGQPPQIGGAVVSILLSCLVGTILAIILSFSKSLKKRYRQVAYGWLEPIIEESQNQTVEERQKFNRVVTVFVVSNLGNDGSFLGYEGSLAHIDLDQNHQITSLSILQCQRFVVTILPDGVFKTAVTRSLIPKMHFSGSQISNFAFNLYDLPVNAN
jgi:hypothetical protein